MSGRRKQPSGAGFDKALELVHRRKQEEREKPLVERLRAMHANVKLCADDMRYGLAPDVMPELAALLEEAAQALDQSAEIIKVTHENNRLLATANSMIKRERRLATAEAEKNSQEDDWMGGKDYPMNAGGKPPLTNEAAEILAQFFPKPHEN